MSGGALEGLVCGGGRGPTPLNGPTAGGTPHHLTPPPPLNPTSPREASPTPRGPSLSPSIMPSFPLPPAPGVIFPFLKSDKPVYSSSPQAASCPENNSCRLIEYRGAKLAAFNVDGRELICLPQAFELFLKHLVGGLHTVYTKLKRLDITPVVCNVEQVRVLRGLGAIQPGVNRCKLIAPKEFDVLYDDCTNASSRPGRPPKRTSMMASPDSMHEKLKKSRMEAPDYNMPYTPNKLLDMKKSPLFANGYHYPPQMAPLPFLPLSHPAMMNLAMANHLSAGMRPDHILPINQATTNGLDLTAARKPDQDAGITEPRDHAVNHTKPLNLQVNKPNVPQGHLDRPRSPVLTSRDPPIPLHDPKHMNHQPQHSRQQDEDDDDDYDSFEGSDDEERDPKGVNELNDSFTDATHKNLIPGMLSGRAMNAVEPGGPPPSSLETLLLNILGLLKVAAQNAKNWEQQVNSEKAELKMHAAREKEIRDKIERQLMEEQKIQSMLQKKLKKERKLTKHLRDQLELSAGLNHTHRFSLPQMNGTADDSSPPRHSINRFIDADQANSDGEQSTCSSDVPSPSGGMWRDQPAFPHPIPAPHLPHTSAPSAVSSGEQHSTSAPQIATSEAPSSSPYILSPERSRIPSDSPAAAVTKSPLPAAQ